jgi:transposase
MIAIGADVHKRMCTLAAQYEDGRLEMLPSMENTRENWLHLVKGLPAEAELALEVSTSGYFVMSVLEEGGWRERAHWVHTAGVDTLRKQKYDRLDARRLARKLSVAHRDPLPEAWFPPPLIRQLRLRARHRCRLTAESVAARNRVRSLLQMHGVRLVHSPLSAAGRQELGERKLPDVARDYLESMQRVYDSLLAEREKSEASLLVCSKASPEIARLRTLPGIGHILGALIWSEIGELKRFASADALVNYTGLVPSLYESGETSHQGSITRQGPVWLRWALVAAANAAVKGHNPFAQRYRALRGHGKEPLVATVAVARSMARCIYGVLKHGQDYQAERWGRRRRVGEQEQKA